MLGKYKSLCLLTYCRLRSHRLVSAKFSTSSKRRNVRVRFAPSPTGFLHIGGLRTALLNYLFAKSQGGKFIVRIEDTDQTRIVPGAVENLLEQLRWVGITPDEGPTTAGDRGPYVQSERLEIYKKHSEVLLENGSAYRCFCSQRRLDILRRDQLRRKEHSRYDNRCKKLSADQIEEKLGSGEPFVLRLKLSNESKSFDDLLFGEMKHDVAEIEGDPVIFKSDGYPTYHLANVVDDHLMKITHVMRGREWLLSTVKHVTLYEAFGWTPPKFAHLPLFLNEDGKKLSKRQGDVYVEQYRAKGYHPTSILNFMAHYGAGFSEDIGTIFGDNMASPESTLQKMVEEFSMEKVGNTDSVIRFWKLDEFNSAVIQHLLKTDSGKMSLIKELRKLVEETYDQRSLLVKFRSEEEIMKYLERVLMIRNTHIDTLQQLILSEYDYVWTKPEPKVDKFPPESVHFLQEVRRILENTSEVDLSTQTLLNQLRTLVKKSKLKMAPAMTLLRNLLTGREVGPGIAEIISIIGIQEAIERLDAFEHSFSSVLNSDIEK